MAGNLKTGLLLAYRQLLSPLVRILLRNGVPADQFAALSRSVYVDVAESLLREKRELETDANVSLMTGLSETDIQQLRRENREGQSDESRLLQITKILSGWHTDNFFTGPYGLPLELPLFEPGKPSFEMLVDRYCPARDARDLLNDLLRAGVVKETEKNWFKVLTRTYLPTVDAPESIERLGQAVANFVATIDHNRAENNPDERFFERIVTADNGIRKEDLPIMKAYIKERAQLLLEEIDNWLSQLDPPEKDGDSVINTGVGIYHFVDEHDSSD